MDFLIAGLLLWALVHLMPSVQPALKSRLIATLGAGPYKGLFAVLVLLGLVMIVIGWHTARPAPVYAPPGWGRAAAFGLMLPAVLLFGAAHARTSIKRLLRHPQLVGLLLWSIAHLLANGDARSLTLFGGLALWALIEIPVINRRDGTWVKPEPAPVKNELITIIVSTVVFALLIALHPYFSGAPALPMR